MVFLYRPLLAASCLIFVFSVRPTAADVVSGPGEGNEVKALKIAVVTGDSAGKELDMIAERKEQPTIYVFVPTDRFSRPMARFLKALDERLHAERPEINIVPVWLTDDVAKAKDYLPKVQESLKLNRTTWSVFPGEKTGPADWGINPDADVTVIVADGKKVKASLGYRSINETEVPKVWERLPPKK